MTPEQFYNNTIDIYYAYEKAYITKLHEEAYIQGLYNFDAFGIALTNALRTKKTKTLEYYKEPVYSPYSKENIKKKNVTLESVDNKYKFWGSIFHKRKESGK